ncbi:activating signal cointegrator 1 isoform X2 [Cylas formicarius]|uniref:activating signal cointegrator 1 isoform X2 n=1 Tax=Cylas formicarius TaxID=197179 RepID=UPI0029584FB7|nr:activating signal cointegrator 1 isoform X2 [Cylas formicarius]
MSLQKAIVDSIHNHLTIILGEDVEPNIVEYIRGMKHEEDFEEFMENIVNKNDVGHVTASVAIKNLIFSTKKVQSKFQEPQTFDQKHLKLNLQGKKEKKKFRSIKQFEEEKTEMQGRSTCDCLGQEHDFLNNCIECGRIHCIKEGPGPCLFCGNMISIRGATMFDSKGKKSVMKPKKNKVFDDDNDYFKINSKKEETEKNKMVIALDLASRKVIESSEEDVKIRKMLLQDSIEHLKKVENLYKNIERRSQFKGVMSRSHNALDDLVDLLIQMRHRKPAEPENLGIEDSKMPANNLNRKILDEDMLPNMDQGLCLSLHQPYASLLVAGVKRHEGRVWYTNHRGRLWIAAAAKQPEEDEVRSLETFYKDFHKDPSIKFPREYPTSCLLGCVYVEDCLDQETYRKRFSSCEESGSPYVMICSNPIILPIYFPISGKHKIYPLDKELHSCAKIALQHVKYF